MKSKDSFAEKRLKGKNLIAAPRWSEVFPFSSKILLFLLLVKKNILLCVKSWEGSIFANILSKETSVFIAVLVCF